MVAPPWFVVLQPRRPAPLILFLPPLLPAAQPPTVPAGMASRVLACTTCHGKEGRATAEGFPRIAGKPAGYLRDQLLNFRDGRRGYPQMGYSSST